MNNQNLKLVRIAKRPNYTIGKLYLGEEYICDTLEDTVRQLGRNGKGKIKHNTAIPADRYEVKITYSNRFKCLMPLLIDVPFFEGIRIHSGNTHENTSGCILVGDNSIVGGLTSSKLYYIDVYTKIEKALKKGKLYIDII
jgi:hypothetical protein